MNNLVIFVIFGAFLCGTAVGLKQDFAKCGAASECKSKCCFGSCLPLVEGICVADLLEKVCGTPGNATLEIICPLVRTLLTEIGQLESGSGVVPSLLKTVTGLLSRILAALNGLNLDEVTASLNALLGNLDGDLSKLVPALLELVANLLTGLLG